MELAQEPEHRPGRLQPRLVHVEVHAVERRGHEQAGARRRRLSRLLHAARQRAGTADRRTEARTRAGSVEFPPLPGQRAKTDDAYVGLSLVCTLSRSQRRDQGGRHAGGRHGPRAIVQSRRRGGGAASPHLVPSRQSLARPKPVDRRGGSRAAARRPAPSRLAGAGSVPAESVPRSRPASFRAARARNDVRRFAPVPAAPAGRRRRRSAPIPEENGQKRLDAAPAPPNTPTTPNPRHTRCAIRVRQNRPVASVTTDVFTDLCRGQCSGEARRVRRKEADLPDDGVVRRAEGEIPINRRRRRRS